MMLLSSFLLMMIIMIIIIIIKILWKWTLESKSEYIVENDAYHLVIFQKCICFC